MYSTIEIIMPRRQQGRSYLGVLDCDSHSVSLLDIPFSDLSNVVCIKILNTSLKILVYLFVLWSIYWLVTCSIWQVAGDDYFYIEGASASIPLSIAKVYQTSNAYFWLFVADVHFFLSWMPIDACFFFSGDIEWEQNKSNQFLNSLVLLARCIAI